VWRMSHSLIGDKAGPVRRRWHLPVLGRVRSALILTVVAGLVDAAAYLGLGGVFVANQTGNCVLLAIGSPSASGSARTPRGRRAWAWPDR
jgi:hypothetical protein